ncbi:ABC transporter permease [Actinomycetes bacterium KLBMP 9797]
MLLRNVFTKAIWDGRRSLLGWTLAVAVVGAMYASFWPSVDTPQMQDALASYPEGMLEAFNYNDLTSAAGYLGSSVYGLLVPLLVAVFAIGVGTRMVAGDEEAGTLDLLLAHPVSRVKLALERFGAFALALTGVAAVLWLAMLAISGPAKLDDISVTGFTAIHAQLVLFGLWFGALAFAIGAATGRKALTLGTSAGVAVLAYLANSVIPMVDGLEWTKNLSPFHWYLGGEPLENGFQWDGVGLLAATAAVLVAAGAWRFTHRDVSV